MVSIPLRNLPAQRFELELDGQECTFTLRQINRYLYLDLDVGRRAACRGAVCQHGASIVCVRNGVFKGTLHFFDTLQAGRRPIFSDLQDRFLLVYCAEGEALPIALAA